VQEATAVVAEEPILAVKPQVERRGPKRAKNVARLPQKEEPKLEPKVQAEPKKTGTDDEWSEF
jgi:hypothetical protein